MPSQPGRFSTPPWLQSLTHETITQGPFPLAQVLQDSFYYPAAGSDGNPIEMLSHYAASFVHVDYRLTKAEVKQELQAGFAGYDLVGMREVAARELTPAGWRPSMPPRQGHRPLPAYAHPSNAFALWAVYARQAAYPASHGAERFSLLHLHSEGVAAYDALYRGNGHQARFLGIIQPGEGYGDNWTRFTQPGEPLHEVVTGHPQGAPAFLVRGGHGDMEYYKQQPCWPEYTELVQEQSFWKTQNDSFLTVWAR